MIHNPGHWSIDFLSWEQSVCIADDIAIGDIIHMLETVNDCIVHGVFFKTIGVNPGSKGVLAQLFNCCLVMSIDVVQIFVYVLGPVSYRGEEEKNIWHLDLNFSTFNHSSMAVKKSPRERVWNFSSIIGIKNFRLLFVKSIIKKHLLRGFFHNKKAYVFI